MRVSSLLLIATTLSLLACNTGARNSVSDIPTGPGILSEVQLALRTKEQLRECRMEARFTRQDDSLKDLLLSMTPSNIYSFKYFKRDGVVEIELMPGGAERIILLWVATESGHCRSYEFSQAVE